MGLLWIAAATAAEARVLRIGLAPNLAANQPYSQPAARRQVARVMDAGANILTVSETWAELEPAPHTYRFDDLDFWIGEADRYDVPVVLTVRVIETNHRALPADLQNKPFDGRGVRRRLAALFDALAKHAGGRINRLIIGNEVDVYLRQHPGEVSAFATLLRRARARLRHALPGTRVSSTVTFTGLVDGSDLLGPLRPYLDFVALTYYPLRSDFLMRDPDRVDGDVQRMVEAAQGKRLLLVEAGYASSPAVDGSDERQARFVDRMFDAVETRANEFIGVNFFLLADFSEAFIEEAAQAYGFPFDSNFRNYIGSIGFSDRTGVSKPSWTRFDSRLRKLRAMRK